MKMIINESSVYALENEQKAIEEARARGCTIIRGNDNTLLLDIDTKEGADQYLKMKSMVDKKFGILHTEEWPSKSGGDNFHVKIIIKTSLPPLARIALQTILGSDPKRECFGVYKYSKGVEEPNLLFKPKEKTPLSLGPYR